MGVRGTVSWRSLRHGREGAGYLGEPGSRCFVAVHLPTVTPRHAVLMCPATYTEQLTGYRTEVLLGRHLAEAGAAVLRFQYRSTGNSDEAPEGYPSYQTMLDDALTAATWLEDMVPSDCRTSVLGTGLGAICASAVARRRPESPVAFVQPVLEGRPYFRELLRARRTAQLSAGSPDPGEDALTVLQRAGWIEAFGNLVGLPTYATLCDRRLEDELGPTPRPVLVVQMTSSDEVRGELQRQVARWQEQGFAVTSTAVRRTRSWWFVPDAWDTEEDRPETTGLLGAVGTWVLATGELV